MAKQFGSTLQLPQVATPAAPPSGATLLYFKSDGLLYRMSSTGGELPVDTTGSGGPPSGAAGGALAGTYPNPTLAANSVGSAAIVDGSILIADISTSSVRSDTIGVPSNPVNQANQRIFNLADPTVPTDAATARYIQARGTDLVANGTGFMQNNFNMTGGSSVTYEPTDAPYGITGSFRATTPALSQTIWINEYIPIDTSKRYQFSLWLRQRSATSGGTAYGAIAAYDISNTPIQPHMYAYNANTLTTLAADLNVNDTTMTLTSAANWSNSPTWSNRLVIFWDWVDSTGRAWPANTFSRNYIYDATLGAYPQNGITGNVVTLAKPWPGPMKPAGTQVSNGVAGSNYIYNPVNIVVPQTWTNYAASLTGTNLTGTSSSFANGFPPGTAYVKVGALINYTVTPSDIAMAGLSFSDASAANALALTKNKVYYQAAAPSGGTYYSGDLWFDTANGNRVNIYSGSAWVLYQYGSTALATGAVTSTQIADGTIAAIDLAAGAVTAPKIGATIAGDNLLDNSNFLDTSQIPGNFGAATIATETGTTWRNGRAIRVTSTNAANAFGIGAYAYANGVMLSTQTLAAAGLLPNTTYTFSAWCYIPAASGVTQVTATITGAGFTTNPTSIPGTATNTWMRLTVTATTSANATDTFTMRTGSNANPAVGLYYIVGGWQLETGDVWTAQKPRAIETGIDIWLQSARVGTIANITLSGTQTVDGVALNVNDRVLVKNQTTTSQNGVYTVQSGAWTRAVDANTTGKLAAACITVQEGTQTGRAYQNKLKSTDTLGTTGIDWWYLVDNLAGSLLYESTIAAGTAAQYWRGDKTWQTPPLLADGDKGDISVGGSGTTLTIDALAVTGAKVADGTLAMTKMGTGVNLANIAGTYPSTGNITASGFKVTNLADPTVATDATTKQYVDGRVTANPAYRGEWATQDAQSVVTATWTGRFGWQSGWFGGGLFTGAAPVGILDSNNGANPGEFIVQNAGYYQVNLNMTFSANTTGYRQARLLVNGNVYSTWTMFPSSTNNQASVGGTTELYCAAGTILRPEGWQSSGAGLIWQANYDRNVITIASLGQGPKGDVGSGYVPNTVFDTWSASAASIVTSTWTTVTGWSPTNAPYWTTWSAGTPTFTVAGMYYMTASITWVGSTGARNLVALYRNGAEFVRHDTGNTNGGVRTISCSGFQMMNIGDTANVMCWQNSGAALALSSSIPPGAYALGSHHWQIWKVSDQVTWP